MQGGGGRLLGQRRWRGLHVAGRLHPRRQPSDLHDRRGHDDARVRRGGGRLLRRLDGLCPGQHVTGCLSVRTGVEQLHDGRGYEHCFNGFLPDGTAAPNAVTRELYVTKFLPRMAKRWAQTAPKGANMEWHSY